MELPDVVLVGHITRNLVPGGNRPGGSVMYGAHLAARWGYRPAVFTATANAAEARSALPEGTLLHSVPFNATTTFRNQGTHPLRQRVSAIAAPLITRPLPPQWREAPVFLLAPVIGEVDSNFLRDATPTGTIGVCLQGWLRTTDREETVHPLDAVTLDLPALMPRATAVVLSDEDLAGTADAEAFLSAPRQISTSVLLTLGEAGVRLLTLDARHDLPALPSHPLDPTDAGDVFATAFLLGLAAREAPLDAAMLAQAASARAIEEVGTSAIPTLEQTRRTLTGAA